MEVRILKKIIGGNGIAVDKQNRTIFVKNGGFFNGEKVKIDIISNENNIINAIVSKTNISISELISKSDKYHLIHATKLTSINSKKNIFFEFEKYIVSVDKHIIKVVELLINRPELWAKAKFKINPIGDSIIGEVSLLGVDFQKAIENSLRYNIAKARYYTKDKENNWEIPSDMLVIIGKETPEKLQIEIWQSIGETTEMFYIHGYFYPSQKIFDHLDGAIITMDFDTINKVFSSGKKIKVGDKNKHFRIDTEIDYNTAFDLIKCYMPIKELVNEFLYDNLT